MRCGSVKLTKQSVKDYDRHNHMSITLSSTNDATRVNVNIVAAQTLSCAKGLWMKEDKKFYVFPEESACTYVYFGERGLHATNACKDSSFFGDRRNEACMVNMEDLLAACTRLQV